MRRIPQTLCAVMVPLALWAAPAGAEQLDRWLVTKQPENRMNTWDNVETQVVVNLPRLKFDPVGAVSYQMSGIRLGVGYLAGHPSYDCARAPFLGLPLTFPVMPVPIEGLDIALRMNIPVLSLGGGTRPPVEMDLAVTLQMDLMMRALGSFHPSALFARAVEAAPADRIQ